MNLQKVTHLGMKVMYLEEKKYPPRLTGAFVIYKMKRDMSWLPAMSERQ